MAVELSTLGDVIKTAYEGQSNTNAFTDALQSKLNGIEAGADVTPTLADVATSGAYGDLTGTPTLGTAASQPSSAFATAAQGALADTALQSVPAGVAVADAVDETDVVAQFNALLASLRGAGLIAS